MKRTRPVVENFYDETDPVKKGRIWLDQMKNYEHRTPAVLTNQILKTHPFGLTMLSTLRFHPNIHHLRPITIFRIIDAMPLAIIREIANDRSNQSILGLRKINAQCDRQNRSHHLVYYEVLCENKILFIGHCSDFSGTGGVNKEHMDSLISYLAHRYKLTPEEVEVPYFKAVKGIEMFP